MTCLVSGCSGYGYITSSTHIVVQPVTSPPTLLDHKSVVQTVRDTGYHQEVSGVWGPHVVSVAEARVASREFQYPESAEWACRVCDEFREVSAAHRPPPVSACECCVSV